MERYREIAQGKIRLSDQKARSRCLNACTIAPFVIHERGYVVLDRSKVTTVTTVLTNECHFPIGVSLLTERQVSAQRAWRAMALRGLLPLNYACESFSACSMPRTATAFDFRPKAIYEANRDRQSSVADNSHRFDKF